MNIKHNILLITTCLVVLLACILPMGLNPNWNGDIANQTNQYELMAQSLLQGRVNLDLPVNEKLLALNNPYDPNERDAAGLISGVDYNWDHAFYNGKYYMYFGIVPVLLVFLPFQFITGNPLITYHATQLFVCFFIIGIFALFWKIRKRFFHEMPMVAFLALSASFSIMSVWYSIGEPALYCTATTSAMCMGVWCFNFFFSAVNKFTNGVRTESKIKNNHLKVRIYLILGALFGALTFGCRPPLGFINVILIPIMWSFFKRRTSGKQFAIDAVVSFLPYVIVAILLMTYNFVRFDSAFEFGQSYQLTNTDQHTYSENLGHFDNLLDSLLFLFFGLPNGDTRTFQGIFISYPILFLCYLTLLSKRVRKDLKSKRLVPYLASLIVGIIMIGVIDSVWAPFIIERYRMDLYWICGIISFTLLGVWSISCKRKLYIILMIIAAISVIWVSVYFLFTPFDKSFGIAFPELSTKVREVITFGLNK